MILKRAVALLALAFLAVLSPLAAQAHDQLIESYPSSGDVLTSIPAQLTLEFSDEIIPMSPAILIQDGGGATVFETVPELSGRTASAPFPELADGPYSLNWSVVSADGHRIEGAIPFEMATGVSPAEQSQTGASAALPSPTLDENSPATDPRGGWLSNAPLPLKIVLLAGAATPLVIVIMRRLRRRPPSTPSQGIETP